MNECRCLLLCRPKQQCNNNVQQQTAKSKNRGGSNERTVHRRYHGLIVDAQLLDVFEFLNGAVCYCANDHKTTKTNTTTLVQAHQSPVIRGVESYTAYLSHALGLTLNSYNCCRLNYIGSVTQRASEKDV